MAIIKCKMCGGDLNITEGVSVAECEYCGTRQTVPNVDSEKKLTLFSRANRLRLACEFDKAASVYESIVADFPEEAEAYWGVVLCRYGIEYVDDPAMGKKVPTCHRSSFESILKDTDFEQACENTDTVARKVYRDEAKVIEEIRKGILEVSGKEPPYDIFICYKETDENGERTIDSVLAQDVYDALTDKGYRVFFSRISLEDKLGTEYEPYIFAALNSAKVMLVFGTDYEYFNAVWVKNEWSRFLKLMARDKSKHLIPCYKDVDAYDLPEEFQKLQAQDVGKVGAVQDLLRGIDKLLGRTAPAQAGADGPTVESLLKRGRMSLADRKWNSAKEQFDKALNLNPECAEAYLGKYCAEHHYQRPEEMAQDTRMNSPVWEKTLVSMCRSDGNFKRAITTYQEQTGYDFPAALDAIRQMVAAASAAADAGMENWVADADLARAMQFASPQLRKELEDCLSRAEQHFQAREAENQHKKEAAELEHRRQEAAKEEQCRRLAERRALLQKAASCITCGNGDFVIGVKADGTLCWAENLQQATGTEPWQQYRKTALTWKNIAQVVTVEAVQNDYYKTSGVVGLRKDGTLVWVGKNLDFLEKETWSEIVSIRYTTEKVGLRRTEIGHILLGLKRDGSVAMCCSHQDSQGHSRTLRTWKHITKIISVENQFIAGLQADGTVVYLSLTLDPLPNIYQTKEWSGIVDIAASGDEIFGLKEDGTVVPTKAGPFAERTTQWTDIVALGICDRYAAGIKYDGTLVMDNCLDENVKKTMTAWTDVVAVFENFSYKVGVKADGTVVRAESYGAEPLLELDNWKLFQGIETLEQEKEESQKQYEEAQERLERLRQEEERRREEERARRKDQLEQERTQLQRELDSLKGLFTGKRRREIEARLAEIETELKKL